jgi:hypothetical protein
MYIYTYIYTYLYNFKVSLTADKGSGPKNLSDPNSAKPPARPASIIPPCCIGFFFFLDSTARKNIQSNLYKK